MDIVLISSTTRYSGTYLNYSNEPSIVIDWLASDDLTPNDTLLEHVFEAYKAQDPIGTETLETLRKALTLTEEDLEAGDEFDMTLQDQKTQAISGWLPELQTLLGQTLTIIDIYNVTDNGQ